MVVIGETAAPPLTTSIPSPSAKESSANGPAPSTLPATSLFDDDDPNLIKVCVVGFFGGRRKEIIRTLINRSHQPDRTCLMRRARERKVVKVLKTPVSSAASISRNRSLALKGVVTACIWIVMRVL